MNKVEQSIFILFLALLISSCASLKEKDSGTSLIADSEAVAHKEHTTVRIGSQESAIVYKTKNDYYNNVPIILSEDKSKIINYPAIYDVYYKGKLAYPTLLNNGYLLDNRGINKNVAFLSYTYEAYSGLEKTPSKKELFKNIIDKDPLLEIIDFGPRNNFTDEVAELNALTKREYLTSPQ